MNVGEDPDVFEDAREDPDDFVLLAPVTGVDEHEDLPEKMRRFFAAHGPGDVIAEGSVGDSFSADDVFVGDADGESLFCAKFDRWKEELLAHPHGGRVEDDEPPAIEKWRSDMRKRADDGMPIYRRAFERLGAFEVGSSALDALPVDFMDHIFGFASFVDPDSTTMREMVEFLSESFGVESAAIEPFKSELRSHLCEEVQRFAG